MSLIHLQQEPGPPCSLTSGLGHLAFNTNRKLLFQVINQVDVSYVQLFVQMYSLCVCVCKYRAG